MSDYEERHGAFVHRLANVVGDVVIGEGTRVDAFVTITGHGVIGKGCHVGTGACIFGGAGFEIGNYTGISPGAKFFTGSEDFSGEWAVGPGARQELRNVIKAFVRIGSHCNVGANSILLPGSEMPDGCVIGALSLAKGRLSEWSIWAGVPAKKLKDRTRGVLSKILDHEIAEIFNSDPAFREKET